MRQMYEGDSKDMEIFVYVTSVCLGAILEFNDTFLSLRR